MTRGFSASPAQREKCREEACAVCNAPAPSDPAHLCARAQGGCDEAACVVPLCRLHHREFDTGELDLLGSLEPWHRPELAHAVEHLGLMGTVRRVTNDRNIS